ncbi:MAG: outer membrane beta-barrel protein [Terriglobales bacterium]
MNRKTKTLAAALLLSSALPAMAADLPTFGLKDGPAALGSWTGFYAGVNGGYGWDSKLNLQDTLTTGTSPNITTDTYGGGLTPAGAFGGVTVGANWEVSNFVFGVETDLDVANIADDSGVVKCVGTPCTPTAVDGALHSTIDWFGTLRARAGLPLTPNFLVYGTGGLAYGGVSTRGTADSYSFKNDQTRVGWAAGAGAEWKFSPGWSLRGEWLYMDLGGQGLGVGTASPNDAIPETTTPDNAVNMVRLGLVYKIGADLK